MRRPRRLLGLLALAGVVRGDTLPYNPTRIILPSNSSFAYIFGPSTESNDQAQFFALDISDSIHTSSYQASTISKTLPFLQSNQLLPYAPTLDATGNITVIAGECDEKASNAKVWQFQPDLESSTAEGTWRQRSTSYKEGADVTGYAGLGYLANSIAFSDSVSSDGADVGVYIFGGMCPFDNSTSDTWISRAEYSNSMLTISPDASDYDISLVASRGPPIQQAGSSITALTPTYSVNGAGDTQIQQQDFVLLGGNTEVAFINMSQVALFSLPQQSWSFVDVQQPTNARTDLAIRQASQNVTPRSGHTAVLSETGDSIILFGGWVGDVDTPAQPQLAILELGAGYGGSGDWRWTIPEQSDSGFEAGAGVYGHGAAMLPGGVMMVVGGYEIPATSSKLAKRQSQTANTRLFLYNTTSQSWIDSYRAPEKANSGGGGPLSSTKAKVGLGTGLGIGAALLITMGGFYLWYGKRLKSAQEDRERALLSYSSDGSTMGQVEQPFLGGDKSIIARPWPASTSYDDGHPRPPPMHHATGAFVNVPSPTRGLRKGPANKLQFHSAARPDDKRVSRGSGSIHPIAEHDDEDAQEHLAAGSVGMIFSDAAMRLKDTKRISNPQDPFADDEPNPLGSHPIAAVTNGTVRRVPTNASKFSPPPHPQSTQEMTAANWMVDNKVFEDYDNGFTLVNGDDRTSSTLSERSQHSTASTSSITRTMSTKTGAWLAAAAAAQRAGSSPQRSPTHERNSAPYTATVLHSNTRSRTRTLSSSHGSFAEDDGDPFIGVRPTLSQLEGNNDTLMNCRQSIDPDDPYQRAMTTVSPTKRNTQQSMFSSGAHPPVPPRRRPGLMGSLRRALHAVSLGDRSVSLSAASDPYEDGNRSSSSSPTKDRTGRITNIPRRAVSDGGALLAQKRGQKDWDPDAWPPYRDDPDAGDWGEPTEPKSSSEMRQAEEEWDVETAAVNRDFQVMFTVPKSKLRVVNDDMDRASLLSASDGGLSRNGSVRRENSLKALKVRTDGANLRLPSTEEEIDDSEKEKAA